MNHLHRAASLSALLIAAAASQAAVVSSISTTQHVSAWIAIDRAEQVNTSSAAGFTRLDAAKNWVGHTNDEIGSPGSASSFAWAQTSFSDDVLNVAVGCGVAYQDGYTEWWDSFHGTWVPQFWDNSARASAVSSTEFEVSGDGTLDGVAAWNGQCYYPLLTFQLLNTDSGVPIISTSDVSARIPIHLAAGHYRWTVNAVAGFYPYADHSPESASFFASLAIPSPGSLVLLGLAAIESLRRSARS
jgi:hypothetical protein